jgi:transcriptional regulator with XRE-family HTH domain
MVKRSRKTAEPITLTAAEYLRGARKKRGVTQVQLAAILGCSNAHISQIESGAANPSKRLQAAIEAWVMESKTPRAAVAVTEPPVEKVHESKLSKQCVGAAVSVLGWLNGAQTVQDIKDLSEAVLNLCAASIRAKELE